MLDRVVRGRAWIPLLGVLLAGIVAAQVEILKLGASMGRALEQTSTLTNQNQQLRANVAALADDQRIERLAAGMGMVLPPPGSVGFLFSGRNDNVAGALDNLHTPDSAAFVMIPAKNGALVTGPGTSTLPPDPGAPAPPPAATTPTSGATATGSTTITTTTPAVTTPAQSTNTTPQATTPQATTPQQTSSPQTPTQQAPTQQTPTQQAPPSNTSTGSPANGGAAIQPSNSGQSTAGG